MAGWLVMSVAVRGDVWQGVAGCGGLWRALTGCGGVLCDWGDV